MIFNTDIYKFKDENVGFLDNITSNIIRTELWNFNNTVTRNELVQHRFWGRPYGCLEYANSSTRDKFFYMKDPAWLIRFKKFIQNEIFKNEYRMELQYCGLNGQTLGQDGSIHRDSENYNDLLTILFFIQDSSWEDSFGGDLILYEDDETTTKQIIKYVPGDIVKFDGYIPHKSMAPIDTNKMRISLVMRGKIFEI